MRTFLRILVVLFSLIIFPEEIISKSFQNETLKYTISYKWGLVHKDAGEAVLNLKKNGTNYDVMLTAKTKPWADKIYQVRDTLKGVIRINDLKPLSYSKLTHEKGEFKKDEIKYSFSGSTTTGKSKRYRYKKGKQNVTEKTFSATGPVYDMLSVFYYLRSLDFEKLANDKVYMATIFSGKQKENIKIKSLGIEKIKMRDKTTRNAYHIKFNFTREGGKKSSDDIDTWISTDSAHVPLYLTAKLPIGQVRAYLTN